MSKAKIESVTGRAVAVHGDDIDTDRIIPARFLKTITFDGLQDHLFEDDRVEAQAHGKVHPIDDPVHTGAKLLLGGSIFGCGSSREHAPQGLHRWGIQAIVGESFAEIFFGNSLMIGMPCVTASPADVRALMDAVEKNPAADATIDLLAGTCEVAGFRCAIALPPKVREAFITGAWDTTGMLLDDFE
jgi:3-isopropylmalate/(R)-2-methylmalate dehydratase small subunit